MRRAKHVCMLIGVLCVGLPAMASAQAAGAQTFEAGVKGGLAVTSMPHAGEVFDQIVGVTTNESTSRLGLTGGGYVRFPINEWLGFQPEAMFTMKGVETYQSSSGGNVKVRVNYFEIPLLVRFRFADTGSGIVRYAIAGPSFGIKISDSAHADLNSLTKDLADRFSADVQVARPRFCARRWR